MCDQYAAETCTMPTLKRVERFFCLHLGLYWTGKNTAQFMPNSRSFKYFKRLESGNESGLISNAICGDYSYFEALLIHLIFLYGLQR